MRAREFISESRGVTARSAGETYISTSNPADILTLQAITVVSPPEGGDAFETSQDMLAAVDTTIPSGANKVEDNRPTAATRAAIVAQVTDTEGDPQFWVRYLQRIPAGGVHGSWPTLRGYKLQKAVETESLPIKPTDFITDDAPKTVQQVARLVKTGVRDQMSRTAQADIVPVIHQAVDQAQQGGGQPIAQGAKYATVVGKYAGEYLGPMWAITQGASSDSNIQKLMKSMSVPNNPVTNLAGSTISFPQDTANKLVDCFINHPNGMQIEVSSKMHRGSGAASSLTGLAEQLTPEMIQKFPRGAAIIQTIATQSVMTGPLELAQMFNLITAQDVQVVLGMNKNSRSVQDVNSAALRELIQSQPIAAGSATRDDYRVLYHLLMAIVNKIVPRINAETEFAKVALLALNNNNFLQLKTHARAQGENLLISYSGQFPALFAGVPKAYNKSYFATGKPNSKLGFKLY